MRRSLALAVALLVCALVGASAASAASSDLLFSEYVEGSGNNKALEIFNDTGAPVDLAAGGYNVQIFFNGSATAGLTINLTGTVADGDVFVLAQSAADPAILAARGPDEWLGLVQRRRRRRAAEGHDGARRDRPDRLRPRSGVGDGRHEHGRQHAAPQADDHGGRPERRGRVRPGGRVGRVPDEHVRRPRRATATAWSSRARRRSPCSRAPRARRRSPRRTRRHGHLADARPHLARARQRARSRSAASHRRAPSAARRAGP